MSLEDNAGSSEERGGTVFRGQWFHCLSCKDVNTKLWNAAISSSEARAKPKDSLEAKSGVKPLVSVALLDLGEIRRSRDGIFVGTTSRLGPSRCGRNSR